MAKVDLTTTLTHDEAELIEIFYSTSSGESKIPLTVGYDANSFVQCAER